MVLRFRSASPVVLAAAALLFAGMFRRATAQNVSVTPDGGPVSVLANATGQQVVFQNLNLIGTQHYTVLWFCSGAVSQCASPRGSSFTGFDGSNWPITFNSGAPGTGTVQLTVTGNGSDQGSYNVTVDGTPPDVRLIAPTGAVSAQYPTIQIAWCDDNSLNAGSRSIKVNGVVVTTSFDYVANSGPPDCVVKATSTSSSAALSIGSNQIDAGICDNVGHCPTKTFFVTRLANGVAVRAELPERQHFSSTSGSQRFFVKNLQGVVATFTLGYACTGTASGCQVTPTTLSNVSPGESRIATLTYSVGAAGTGTTMVKAFDNTPGDSATVAVTVVNVPAPLVSVVGVNPGATLRRDLCVTIAAGSSAAIECGDLRIVHALPSIRTLNKSRTPTLLYNSAHAEPFAVIASAVTLPSSGTLPDSVEGVLKRNGSSVVVGRWGGSDWTLGATRRIALPWAVSPDTIRTDTVYDYTLEVATIYPAPTGRQATAVTSQLIVVDRRGNGFGAGWSLAGLERIRLVSNGGILWVGGDGSARVYQSTPDPNAWVAPPDQRPDTLRRVGGGQYYRVVPGGAKVWFSTTGRHDSTVNRLGQRTAFAYTNGLLTSITLPTAGGGQSYSFTYDSSAPPQRVVTITAPGARVTTLWLSSMRVDSIRDPDNTKVRLTYENGTSRRIATRTDRRGTVTSYNYDVAEKLWRVHTNLQPDSIRLGYTALEYQGLSTASPKVAIDTANAYATFYGPRHYATRPSDQISQVMLFYTDRFGGSRRLRDALNYWTTVRREDGQWPTLPTDVVDATGFETQAGYDGRGNLIRRVSVQPLGPGQDAITRYHWDALWDAVDSIITPMGVTMTMAYNAQNGNRLFEQVGSDVGRRVSFNYGNAQNVLSSVVVQSIKQDSVVYDGQWNVASSRTARGFWTSYFRDALGRDTLIVTPIDSSDQAQGGAADSTTRQRQRTVFTVMDRDSIVETIGPNRVEEVRVDKRYDVTGNLLSLARLSIPDPTNPPIGTITTQWRYDRANRRVAEVAPDGFVDSTDYDPAGDVVNLLTRRKDPTSGARVTLNMSYDALNHLVTRVLPPLTYHSRPTAITILNHNPGGTWMSPDYPAYAIPSETHTFTYDPVGRLLTADNADAKVKRIYYPNGLIKLDSLRIQTVAHDNWEQHKYGLQHTYDVDGRPTVLAVPHQLGIGNDTTISYAYDPQIGALQTLHDLQGNVYTFGYNLQGDLSSVAYPGAYSEGLRYDPDGQLAADTIWNNGSGTYPRIQSAPLVRATSFFYDARHKLQLSGETIQLRDSLRPSYTGLGKLKGTRWTEWGCNGCWGEPTEHHVTDESFTLDAFANLTQSSVSDSINGNANTPWGDQWHYQSSPTCCDTWSYQPGTGRMTTMSVAQQYPRSFYYDSAGNQEFLSSVDPVNVIEHPPTERASFFAADGSLRMVDARAAYITHPWQPGEWQTYVVEEYRYDALGRRVWVRKREWCDDSGKEVPDATECRVGVLRRIIWDGNQELAEIQMPWALQGVNAYTDTTQYANLWDLNETTPVSLPLLNVLGQSVALGDPNPYFGHVIYAGRRGVDQPIAITRVNYVMGMDWKNRYVYNPPRVKAPFTIAPFWNAQGDAPVGVFSTGEEFSCGVPHIYPSGNDTACVAIRWPFNWSSSDRNGGLPHDYWHGTLLDGKRDGSGFRYMRNRLYDPLTGRFTQEDPIGLAGGLNLYGFANGDQVNFSDPFGLITSPKCLKLRQKISNIVQDLEREIKAWKTKPFDKINPMTGKPYDHIGDIKRDQRAYNKNVNDYRENCKDDDDDFNNFDKSLEPVDQDFAVYDPGQQPKLIEERGMSNCSEALKIGVVLLGTGAAILDALKDVGSGGTGTVTEPLTAPAVAAVFGLCR